MSDEDILRFYADEYRESERLTSGAHGQLEFLRTQQIVQPHLSEQPMRIADIGGGPGVYAQWLAGLGHAVELVDPVPSHVSEAEQISIEPGSISARIGDARQLDLSDGSVDMVLFLGPLYHLPVAVDRANALAEAHRVLRPGGFVFAAAISRFASFHDGLSRGLLQDKEFASIVATDLETGHHQNKSRREGWFTSSYFHRPDELRGEVVAAGFEEVVVHGIEGLAGWLPDLDRMLNGPESRATVLEGLDRLSVEPSLLGMSAHMLACGEKTGRP